LHDLRDLPLSEVLCRDLEAWARVASWPSQYSGRPDKVAELKQSGRDLCHRVQEELGAEFDVVWKWGHT